ncbi:MAG: hypothetical protein EZS28_042023, partial [Streblomastix strix]
MLTANTIATVVGAIIGILAIVITIISIVFSILDMVHQHNYMKYKNGMYVSQLSSESKARKIANLSGEDKEVLGYYPSGEIVMIDDGTTVTDASNKTDEEIIKKQRKHVPIGEESEATTRSGDYPRYIDIDLDPNVPRCAEDKPIEEYNTISKRKIEVLLDDIQTRTTIDGNNIYWKDGDIIGIYSVDAVDNDGNPINNVPFVVKKIEDKIVFEGEIS